MNKLSWNLNVFDVSQTKPKYVLEQSLILTLSTLNCLFKCGFSPFSSNNFRHVNHHVYIILLLANLSTTILLYWNNNRRTYQSYMYSSAKPLLSYYITLIISRAVSTNNQWLHMQLKHCKNNIATLLYFFLHFLCLIVGSHQFISNPHTQITSSTLAREQNSKHKLNLSKLLCLS